MKITCECVTIDFEASLNHLRVPLRHCQLERTTNLVERTFVQKSSGYTVASIRSSGDGWDERLLERALHANTERV